MQIPHRPIQGFLLFPEESIVHKASGATKKAYFENGYEDDVREFWHLGADAWALRSPIGATCIVSLVSWPTDDRVRSKPGISLRTSGQGHGCVLLPR